MALVTGVLDSVISKLDLLLKEEYELQTDMRNKITRLSRDLESMHAALRKVTDVPPEQLDDQVKLWARDVRELSYDAVDILDQFLVRVDCREAPDQNWFKRAAKKISDLFSKSKARHQIGGMIKIINEQADMVAERHRRYRIEDVVVKPAATASTVDPRLEVVYKEVTQLVGIETPGRALISMLARMKMVSVVGTGGLGKTTLAKAVYDKIKMCFQCTAFVPVGRDPDFKKVFIDILIELNKDKYMDPKYRLLDPSQLIKELREFLKDKRYLMVIDDIWKIETWKRIDYALVQNNSGSRLIITTRHSDVADQADAVYKLEPLPRSHSEKLFYTRIFGANGTCPNNQLKEVADKILNKCHGVPLAIITMASLLVGKTPGEWTEVGKSVFRENGNQQVSDTEWILSLSYYDLPAHLKTCLLYLSAFPEDCVIEKDRLIWKWIAEGFIHDKEPETRLFDIGERYFNELINRSLIQAVITENSTFLIGIVYGCRIHDVVLDLLRLKSKEENFVTISSINVGTSSSSSNNRVHRLAHQNRTLEQPHQDAQIDLNHLRTLIATNCVIATELSFGGFKLLRVLALEGCSDVNLEQVGNLLHLRYLSLKGTKTCKLAEGVGARKLLQTLDFQFALRIKKEAPDELPSSLGLLTDLICLRAGDAMVPNGVIKKLTSLEELQISTLYCNITWEQQRIAGYYTSRQFVEDLGNLCELRVLVVDVLLEAVECTELVKSISNLKKIQHLELFGFIEDTDQAVWDTAVLPQSLRCLAARGVKFSALPSWINCSALPNLISLELTVRNIDEQGLKILGWLPELRHLTLYIMTSKSLKITIHAADACFQKLRSLSVPFSIVWFVLNEDSSVSFTLWNAEADVAFGSKKRKRDECAVGVPKPTIFADLQMLCFQIRMQAAIICNKLSCANLGLEYLPSLQRVTVRMWWNTGDEAAEEEEAALTEAIYSHPNRPTLEMLRIP